MHLMPALFGHHIATRVPAFFTKFKKCKWICFWSILQSNREIFWDSCTPALAAWEAVTWPSSPSPIWNPQTPLLLTSKISKRISYFTALNQISPSAHPTQPHSQNPPYKNPKNVPFLLSLTDDGLANDWFLLHVLDFGVFYQIYYLSSTEKGLYL